MSITIKQIDTVPEFDPYHADTRGISSTVLKIYSDGAITVGQEYDDNVTPSDVWHGITIEVTMPHVDGVELYERLTGDLSQFLERIHNGHSVEWDGSNYMGYLNDDAADALEELRKELNDMAVHWGLWTAEEWLQNAEIEITPDTTDEEIEKLADKYTVGQHKNIVKDGCSIAIVENCEIIDNINCFVLRSDVVSYLEQER